MQSSLQVCVWYSLNCFGCVYLWLITCIRLPTGPLGTSCLCSCHSSRFEKAHIMLSLPQWQDRIKRSPVPGERKWNQRADLLRCCSETLLKNRPQQNADISPIDSQVSASRSVSASRHDVNVSSVNPFLVKGFHNIYTTQVYVICTEVETMRCCSHAVNFKVPYGWSFVPELKVKTKDLWKHTNPGKKDKCQCEECISVEFSNGCDQSTMFKFISL